MDIKELRDRAATLGSDYLTDEEWVEVIDRLEAAEKERDELRAKIEQMERQEPVGTTGGMPGTTGFTMACFHADKVPIGSKLYTLPGAKGEDK